MTAAQELLVELIQKGVKLTASEDQLKVQAEQGALTSELTQRIKTHKPELLELLGGLESGSEIQKAPDQDRYPLSSAQKRLYFLYQLDPDSLAYHMPQVVRMKGMVDPEHIQRVFRQLIHRHESLRTAFLMENDIPVQRIVKEPAFQLSVMEGTEEEVPKLISEFIRPFDLEQGILIRGGLISLGTNDHILMIDLHHIIMDGISQGILIKDFVSLFEGKVLPEIALHYKDFAVWQQGEAYQQSTASHATFWQQAFAELPATLMLPLDRPRSLNRSQEGASEHFRLNPEQVLRLSEIASSTGSTMYMVLLSAYNVLLSKLSNQEDIVVGTAVGGRHRAELEQMVGMFVNTLALRNYPKGKMTFIDFVRNVHSRTLSFFDHQAYQFEDLIETLQLPRDTSRNPLIDVMFSYNQEEEHELELPGLELSQYHSDHLVTKFDLALNVTESENEGISLNFDYCTDIFDNATIQKLGKQLIQIIDEVTVNEEIKLAEIEILPDADKQRILGDFNATQVDFPMDRSVIDLFEEQSLLRPEAWAIVQEDKQVTYRELKALSDQVGSALLQEEVAPEQIVGVLMEPGVELIATVMGILKAGASFLMIDPKTPHDRIAYMMSNAGGVALVCKREGTKELELEVTQIDIANLLPPDDQVQFPQLNIDERAYVVYTSGSTGKPKGVPISHRSLLNLCYWHQQVFEVTHKDNSTKYAGLGFDASVWEIFPYLTVGATLHIIPEELRYDTKGLHQYYEQHGITISFLPTQVCELFQEEDNHSLRILLTGGDRLKKVKPTNYRLFNNYGPTENTVVSTFCEVTVNTAGTGIPIGKPIANQQAYILDVHNNLAPIGVIGELCLGGAGLTAGYLGLAEMNATRFLPNPFVKAEKIYRTGDLARWLPDGNIEFIGRNDNQVKVRGVRVELGEIERCLLTCSGVEEAAVLIAKDNQTEYLSAYYVSEQPLGRDKLIQELSTQLPEYMLPSQFTHLTSFPLTLNGKVDRRALATTERSEDQQPLYPVSETEIALAKIWKEVLQTEQELTVNKSFFEVGGHSLNAAVLINKVKQQFGAELPLRSVFQHQSIRALSHFIDQQEKSTFESIPQAAYQETYPLSSAQKRMYFLHQYDPASLAYNMPQVVKLSGAVDRSHLVSVFHDLISRHEALRTSFHQKGKQLFQKIHPETDFHLAYFEGKADEVASIIQSFVQPFDLSLGSAIRVGLIKLIGEDSAQSEHILMLDMHHIVTDGVSQGVLIRDFIKLFSGETLQELSLQYKDFAMWQQSADQQQQIDQQASFWLNTYAELPSPIELPLDRKRTNNRGFAGDLIQFELENGEWDRLNDLAKDCGTTMFTMFLSIWNVLLSKVSDQEDIVVGTPVAGRRHADLTDMIGMFVNTLAIRSFPMGELSFSAFLSNVHQSTTDCLEHQDYPYEDLVDTLQLPRDTGRNPLFDVAFSYLNLGNEAFELPSLEVSGFDSGQHTTKFDLTLFVSEDDQGYPELSIEYRTDLFERSTINTLVNYFKRIVSQIVEDPELQLYTIQVMDQAEKNVLLLDFNDTTTAYPSDKSIIELFLIQVRANADHPAVVYGTTSITYRELGDLSDRFSKALLTINPPGNTIIGVCLEKSINAVVAILGILKSGLTYLPLDEHYPEERLTHMIADSGSRLILCQSEMPAKSSGNHQLITVESVMNMEIKDEIGAINDPSTHPAYMLYTSGSTGTPKGVTVSRRSVVNFCYAFHSGFHSGFSSSDRCLSITSLSFDVSVAELFTPLIFGSTLVLGDDQTRYVPENLANMLVEKAITFAYVPPALLQPLLSIFESKRITFPLNKMLVGVEPIAAATLQAYSKLNDQLEIINGYGPTETTICATYYQYDRTLSEGLVPIGKPLANTQIYVMDRFDQLQPLGVPGELCISGEGVSLGYWQNETTTSQKFITNPYLPDQILYKTGDMARWLPDGNLEFLGRIDDQVKINGYRVELNEIAYQLAQHENVEQSAVLVQMVNNEKTLVAYYNSHNSLPASDLRHFLAKTLPDHMIPYHFQYVDHWPTTVNGKLNKKALPLLKPYYDYKFVKPVTETEKKLVAICADLLNRDVDQIGLNQSFFALGGHSLLVMSLVNQIQNTFKVMIPISDIFRLQELQQISALIDSSKTSVHQKIPRGKRREFYPLSSSQRQLHYLQELDPSSVAYNMPYVVSLTGELEVDVIQAVFNTLIERHESFRTRFELRNDVIVQRVTDQFDFKLEVLSTTEAAEDDLIQQFIQPFDLREDLLLRAALIELSESNHLLVVDTHHIACDGISYQQLIKEFTTLHNGVLLPEVDLRFTDYVQWLNSEPVTELISSQKEFWLNEFSGELTSLKLPIDHQRPAVQTFQGATLKWELGHEEAAQLKARFISNGNTLYMLFLSLYSVFLSKITSAQEVIIGTPISGRNHSDLQGVIGMFVQTLAIKTLPIPEQTFTEFLTSIKQTVLECFDNQQYPYEELLNELDLDRSSSENPLFNVFFSYIRDTTSSEAISGVEAASYEFANAISKFDMSLVVTELEDQMLFELEYSTELFEEATALRFKGFLDRLITQVIAEPQIRINEMDILDESQREQLLNEFNAPVKSLNGVATLTSLFDAQVVRSPEHVALLYNDDEVTYAQLDQMVGQVASNLAKSGFVRGDVVAIRGKRSSELVAGMLGILKLGAVCLPIDVTQPEDRVEHMLHESQAKVQIVEEGSNLSESDIQTLYFRDLFIDQSSDFVPENYVPSQTAYIIYTSGSTGKPKGVLINHQAIVNYMNSQSKAYGINRFDRILQFSSISFDPSIEQIWLGLVNGATIVLIDQEKIEDNSAFDQYVAQQGVTHLHATPSYLESIELNQPNHIKRIVSGGESLDRQLIEKFAKDYVFFNKYGPTEATISCAMNRYQAGDSSEPSIGKPIENTSIFILNNDLELLPIGVTGEIYIGGVGLSKGYAQRPDLTEQNFIDHPFAPGEKLYRTGDLARWLPDGKVVFMGRKDDQLKIRGFRVEPKEIESAILTHNLIDVVHVLPDHEKRLNAFIKPVRRSQKKVNGFQRYLLPNNLAVAHLNKNETDFLFEDLYVNQAYFKHGITVKKGDTIFDVGSNIGLFTLQCKLTAGDIRVFAFEPSPTTHNALKTNLELYGVEATIFNVGVSNQPGHADFTFYDKFSTLSGLFADDEDEKEVVRSFIRNREEVISETDVNAIEKILDDKFRRQTVDVELVTLSEKIESAKVEHIDLLKINVEKAELDVLMGVSLKDWEKIDQVVLELHDVEGRLKKAVDLLEENGFHVHVEQDWQLEDTTTSNYYLYARKTHLQSDPDFKAVSNKDILPNPLLDSDELRDFLRTKLPAYMIPSEFIEVAAIPLTHTGKLDKKALIKQAKQERNRDAQEVPSHPIEHQLLRIWADVLKVDPSGIGLQDGFFDIGGHSLLAIKLIARVNNTFEKQLQVSDLLDNPNIRKMGGMLIARGATNSDCLVTLSDKPNKPPLLVLPGAGGQILPLYKLGNLLSDRFSVHAFQAPGTSGEASPLSSVQEMAEKYIEEIERAGLSGPFRLAGYSFGGKVMYEMAARLIQKGHTIKHLIVLDGMAPGTEIQGEESTHTTEVLQLIEASRLFVSLYDVEIDLTIQELEKLSKEEQLQLIFERVVEVGIEVTQKQLIGFINVYLNDISCEYLPDQPHSLDVPIVVLKAEHLIADQKKPENLAKDLGWQQLTQNEVTVCEVPGDHFSILKEPYVHSLVKQLERIG